MAICVCVGGRQTVVLGDSRVEIFDSIRSNTIRKEMPSADRHRLSSTYRLMSAEKTSFAVQSNRLDQAKQEAQLMLRDRATFVSFENAVMLSLDTAYPS